VAPTEVAIPKVKQSILSQSSIAIKSQSQHKLIAIATETQDSKQGRSYKQMNPGALFK
jgi:hypothetical protein